MRRGGAALATSRREVASGRALAALLLLLSACSKPEPSEVEVEVRSVGIDSLSQSPVVVLQDKQHRTALPIWIGGAEAQAIAMQLEGIRSPRPMTHDLMKNLLVQTGVEFERVLIGDLKDRTYIATILLDADGREVEVDSRPSDAIALAVRFQKPIFVAAALLQGETAIDIQRAFGSDTIELRGLSVQGLSDDLAEHFELAPGEGVLVASVADGVEEIQRGDVIVAVNGEKVRGLPHFIESVQALGSTAATLEVWRGGERIEVQLPASPG